MREAFHTAHMGYTEAWIAGKWGCRTHLRSSASCATENIPEPLIEKLAAEAMGRRNFDAELFKQKIKEIHVPENGRLVFVFKDGHTVEKIPQL